MTDTEKLAIVVVTMAVVMVLALIVEKVSDDRSEVAATATSTHPSQLELPKSQTGFPPPVTNPVGR